MSSSGLPAGQVDARGSADGLGGLSGGVFGVLWKRQGVPCFYGRVRTRF